VNLIARLHDVCPKWRTLYGDDPLVAAVELGLIEEDDDAVLSPEPGALDFNEDSEAEYDGSDISWEDM
jgi:hypothetical protein